jgi:hypothetical protein
MVTLEASKVKELRDGLAEIVKLFDQILADYAALGGCTHSDQRDITTMGADNVRKLLCVDCGQLHEIPVPEWSGEVNA